MFPSSCSVSSDIWTPVMWRLGRKLNLIFGFVYFCLFVMWMHICGSLPSLFIDQPLEQARGASHGNPCECIDVIWKDLVCLIWCCPSCSHRLCTSLFILIFCFGSLLILSPCYVALSCSSPFSTAVFSLLLTPWLSHTSRPVNTTAVHTAKANISTGLTHVSKKMLAAAKGGRLFYVLCQQGLPDQCQLSSKHHPVAVALYPQLPCGNCTEKTTRTGVAVPASCHHINTDWHGLTVWPHPHTYLKVGVGVWA